MGARMVRPGKQVLASLEDIERLRSSRLRLWSLDGSIELRIPDISRDDRQRLESRLNHLAGVCGCAESSIVGAIALAAIITWWMWHQIAFSFRSVAVAFAILIGTMLLTKFLRVFIARMQLHHALGQVLLLKRGVMP